MQPLLSDDDLLSDVSGSDHDDGHDRPDNALLRLHGTPPDMGVLDPYTVSTDEDIPVQAGRTPIHSLPTSGRNQNTASSCAS